MSRRAKRRAPPPQDSIELDISIERVDSEEIRPGASGSTPSGTEQLRRPIPANEGRSPGDAGRSPPRRSTRQRSQTVADPNIGKVLGSYRLLSLLGEGGMGRVYCAEHTMLGRKVALKLLRPEYAAKRDAVHRFFQEARAVNAIGHENIVDVTDYVELPSGDTFFIMQLLQGQNLGALIRKHAAPLPLHEAMNIALQVCDALQAAHEKRIVHRDLKPDNIFVTEDPGKGLYVKLLDFGVAKLMGEAAAELSWETAAGSVLGTPAYMSPEQATGLTVDHRTDIYSLGAILYEMFTGQPVFKAKSFGEFVLKHMNDQPVPPSEIVETEIPPALEQIILRCLEKDPEDRYDDVSDLREDLARATATVERAIRRRFSGSSPANSAGSSQRFKTVLFGLVVGALAIAAFWFAAGLGGDGENGSPAVGSRGTGHSGKQPAADSRLQASPPVQHPGRKARSARLQLLSEPSGASVYRKGESFSLGTTPLALNLPNPGADIELIFRSPGFEAVTERVSVTDNAVVSVTLPPLSELTTGAPVDGFFDKFDAVERSPRRRGTTKKRRDSRKKRKKEIRPGEMIDPFGAR